MGNTLSILYVLYPNVASWIYFNVINDETAAPNKDKATLIFIVIGTLLRTIISQSISFVKYRGSHVPMSITVT